MVFEIMQKEIKAIKTEMPQKVYQSPPYLSENPCFLVLVASNVNSNDHWNHNKYYDSFDP